MGGQPQTQPIKNPNQDYQPVALAPEQPWQIPSSHPEYKTEGIASGINSIAQAIPTAVMGMKAGMAAKPDATSQAASAGKVGPVADMTPTPQVQAVDAYMKDPRLMNFLAMQYPSSFKYNPNL
jgi:hypothetical protein